MGLDFENLYDRNTIGNTVEDGIGEAYCLVLQLSPLLRKSRPTLFLQLEE